MAELPDGTVTFLYTDLEGSTRSWEQHPREMRTAVERHEAILRGAIEAYGGRVFRSQGDGLCAVFLTAPRALAAALSAQQALQGERWGEVGPLRVRMALHAGAAEVRNGDYVGSCLNRLGRLLSIASGGQVLVSDVVSDLASDSLPEGASLKDLGDHRLRDLVRAEHIYQLCHPDLTADFPSLKSLDAYPNNLPLQLTSFVGREREIAEVKRLLGTTRLLTLTGAGGSGKTRLAYQVGADLLADLPEEYPDGVWAVELASLADPELVPQAAASALGVREVAGQPILITLQGHINPKRLLLVLDNCEHLLDASARLADALLKACPRMKVFATSREALGLYGETSYRVPSLSLPDVKHLPSLAELGEYESVRLLVERARAVQPSFELTTRNARFVAEVCWRLDGIPLAIELAAARIRGLSAEQLASRLSDRFRLLTGGSRTALRRQQTLRAAIDWSYDLLSGPEKVLFRRLSVFAGGWSLEAAESVCASQGDEREQQEASVERADVLDLLLRLVDRSLVVAEEAGGEDRYSLPETIRQYALEKLLDSGEVAQLRDRHLDWCLGLLSVENRVWTAREVNLLMERLDLERDNLHAALSWSVETSPRLGLLLATGSATRPGVYALWLYRGYPSEGRQWLRQLLDRAPEHNESRAMALENCAWLASDQGDLSEAEVLAEECLGIAREIGNPTLITVALGLAGEQAKLRGDLPRARSLLEEARERGPDVVQPVARAFAIHRLGEVLAVAGDYRGARAYWLDALELFLQAGPDHGCYTSAMIGFLDAAEGDVRHGRQLLEESVSTIRRLGDVSALGWSLSLLGYAVLRDGERDRAMALLRESLAVLQRLGHRHRLGRGLCFVAIVEGERGEHSRAVRLIGAAMSLTAKSQPEFFAIERVDRDACLAAARSSLGEEAFARAWAEGQAMTLDEAVGYALRDER